MLAQRIGSVILLLLTLVACSGGGGGGAAGGGSAPPASPTGLVVSAGNAANVLQWNSVTGATGYNIYWSTVSGAGKSGTKLSGVTSPYTHGSLTNGTPYYYVVTAVNAAGESAASTEVAGTPVVPPPGAPVLTGVLPANQQNTISWNLVTGATSYNLYWSTVSGAGASATKVANVVSPYVHTGLTNGVKYYYSVTAVGTAGESGRSGELGATPLVPPYATATYPFNLGAAPLAGYVEALPGNTQKFHYTLAATPGATYMFHLDNVRDGASLEVFTDSSWNQFSMSLACSSYRFPYNKTRPECPAVAPAAGVFFIRVSATTQYAESVTLSAEEVVNQGSIATPVDLGAAPHLPSPGTVLENGESVYRVAVTPGKLYRVTLHDWAHGSAATASLIMKVYDGAYAGPTIVTAPGTLCSDLGGSGTGHHRLSTIHCLAKPTSNFISIVTKESMYGKGATYKVSVEDALNEGTSAAPVTITGAAAVYAGTVSAAPDVAGFGYSYYKLSVTPNTSYMVDLRGMHVPLDLTIAADSTFTGAGCSTFQSGLIDESCAATSDSMGAIYAKVEVYKGLNDKYVISAIPTPVGAVAPARYPNEGSAAAPVPLGSAPVANRLSTVGAGMSYYSIPVTSGSTVTVSATQMNVDVDVLLYSDSAYLNRICASRNAEVQNDACTVLVPAGVTTLYIAVDGQFTTNNGDASYGTEWDVGGMFRLSVQ